MASAGFADVRAIRQSRYTAPGSLNPMGLAILYSIEFKADFYNKSEEQYVYVGISNQINPEKRLITHKQTAKQTADKMKGKGYDFKLNDKPTYIALGAAFNINPKLETSFMSSVAKIINVVSLFDLGPMEAKYIADKKLQQTDFKKNNSLSDLINLKKGVGNYYGLNDAVGGEGTPDKQAETLSSIEWLFAAYYYVTEKDPYIKDSRKSKPYDEKDSLADKMYKLVLSARNDRAVKIMAITKEEVEKFLESMNLSDGKSYLTGSVENQKEKAVEISPIMFQNNKVLLEISKAVESQGDLRENRNLIEDYLRARMFQKNGISATEIIKVILEFKNKKEIPKLQSYLDIVSKQSIEKAISKINKLVSSSQFQKSIEEDSLSVAVQNIENVIKDEFPNFRPTERFTKGISKKIFDSKKIKKILIDKIILILIEEIKKGLITFTGTNLGELLQTDEELSKQVIKEITGGPVIVDGEKITVQYNKDVKESDITNFEFKNGKWGKKQDESKLSSPRGNKK